MEKCTSAGLTGRVIDTVLFFTLKAHDLPAEIACLRVNRVKAYQRTGTGQRDLSSMGRRKGEAEHVSFSKHDEVKGGVKRRRLGFDSNLPSLLPLSFSSAYDDKKAQGRVL